MTCAPVLQLAQFAHMDTSWKITFVTVSNINLYCIGSSKCKDVLADLEVLEIVVVVDVVAVVH